MAAIFLPRRWRNQPQGAVEVDTSGSLARGLCTALLPTSSGLYETARGAVRFPTGANLGISTGADGLAARRISATTQYWDLEPSGNNPTTGPFCAPTDRLSLLVLFDRFGNVSGNSPIFGNLSASQAPYEAWGLVDAGGTGTASFRYSRPGNVARDASGAIAGTGRKMVIASRGATDWIRVNGSVVYSGATTTGPINYFYAGETFPRGAAFGNYYKYTGASRAANIAGYLACLWDRELSADESLALEENPWQIFRAPSHRLYFSVGAGAPTAYTLDAEDAAFTLTGADATLQASRLMNAAAGSLTITGADASLVVGRVLNAEPGSISLTGADASLLAARALNAEAGAYALTGSDAGLTAARTLDAAAGALSLTGADATLALVRVLNAEPGSFATTGADASLLAARTLDAEAGSFAITGADATLEAVGQYTLNAEPGVFTITGADATLLKVGSYELNAEPGSLSLAGADAGLVAARTMNAEPGSYTLTGADVGFTLARVLNAEAGIFVLTGADATFDAPVPVVVTPVPRKANFSWKEYVERMDGKARAKPDTAYEFSNGRKFEDRG
ncbi:MAG: hypothetical protein NUV51_08025 [Sulfuricaulis sp.]|nr:hypothetical protein [Sulfuricaulis sp.]